MRGMNTASVKPRNGVRTRRQARPRLTEALATPSSRYPPLIPLAKISVDWRSSPHSVLVREGMRFVDGSGDGVLSSTKPPKRDVAADGNPRTLFPRGRDLNVVALRSDTKRNDRRNDDRNPFFTAKIAKTAELLLSERLCALCALCSKRTAGTTAFPAVDWSVISAAGEPHANQPGFTAENVRLKA